MDTKYRQYSETLTTTTTADFFQHLPHGIVSDHIFHRLDFISRVRACCVCPSWRDLFHLPPHPWLCTSPASSSRISLQELPMAYLCKDMEVAGSYDQYMIGSHAASAAPIIYNSFTRETFNSRRRPNRWVMVEKTQYSSPYVLLESLAVGPHSMADAWRRPWTSSGSCAYAVSDSTVLGWHRMHAKASLTFSSVMAIALHHCTMGHPFLELATPLPWHVSLSSSISTRTKICSSRPKHSFQDWSLYGRLLRGAARGYTLPGGRRHWNHIPGT